FPPLILPSGWGSKELLDGLFNSWRSNNTIQGLYEVPYVNRSTWSRPAGPQGLLSSLGLMPTKNDTRRQDYILRSPYESLNYNTSQTQSASALKPNYGFPSRPWPFASNTFTSFQVSSKNSTGYSNHRPQTNRPSGGN